MKTIQVGNLTIDGSRLFLIAGPCVIEGYDRTLMTVSYTHLTLPTIA